MTQINDRLALLIEHLSPDGVSEFSRKIGQAQQKVDRLLKVNKKSGKYPTVLPYMIDAILANYPSVNRTWFLTGEGEMFADFGNQVKTNLPVKTFEQLLTNLMEQQNRLIEKQNSILESQNAEVMKKLKSVQEEMASKGDVMGLKKDLTRQLSEISSEMTDGVSSVLQGLKSLTSVVQKEPVPAGKSRKG